MCLSHARQSVAGKTLRLPVSWGDLQVAPNTLSKSVGVRSWQVSVVCDLEVRPGPVFGGRSRTAANETRTETGVAPSLRVFKSVRDSPSALLLRWLSACPPSVLSKIIPCISREVGDWPLSCAGGIRYAERSAQPGRKGRPG
jgi:hypothetical protein